MYTLFKSHVLAGKSTADNGCFKTDAWTRIEKEFKTKVGEGFTRTMLQNKLTHLKSGYNEYVQLKGNSGFGWDAEKGLPTAPDDVWERYLQAHPKAAPFRCKQLPFYEELKTIFSGKTATGNYAVSSTEKVIAPAHDYYENEIDDVENVENVVTVDSLENVHVITPGKRSATTTLSASGANSGRKKTLKSTVNDGIGSVYNLLKDATDQVVASAPPTKVSLAMKHFKENFSGMYSDDEIITFGYKLSQNPTVADIFLELPASAQETFIRRWIDGEIN